MTGALAENPHAGQGSAVLLDIGGDVGALVVAMPAAMLGEEVEIRVLGSEDHGHDHDHGHSHGHRPHVAVVDRPVPGGGSVPTLVFGELVEGVYELLPKGTDDVRLTTTVRGGEVTTEEWPA